MSHIVEVWAQDLVQFKSLCFMCGQKYFTFTAPLSAYEYEWVLVNFLGTLMKR